MATTSADERLRAMAAHRGLKLLRSRKRTPGVGDYGKFGLTDAAGKAVLGIETDGLAATAEPIEDYLRASSKDDWKRAAEAAARAKPQQTKAARQPAAATKPALAAKPGATGDGRAVARGKAGKQWHRQDERPARARPALRIVAPPEPTPPCEIALNIRAAVPSDAAPIAALLGQLPGQRVDRARTARRLKVMQGADAGLSVAEQDGLVGCCAWAVVPTLQRGPVGRLTLLLVDERQRRRGIGAALVAHAQAALAKAGCTEIEAMSDIRIDNSHNFFRALNFEQRSYRFVRSIK